MYNKNKESPIVLHKLRHAIKKIWTYYMRNM